mgnify:CR=1 FL=1
METTVIAQGQVDVSVGRLLPCPCCGAPASVAYSRTASLGLQGWKSDCTGWIESAYFVRL